MRILMKFIIDLGTFSFKKKAYLSLLNEIFFGVYYKKKIFRGIFQ